MSRGTLNFHESDAMYFSSHEMQLGVCPKARDSWFEVMRNDHGLLCHMEAEQSMGSRVKGWAMGDARFSKAHLSALDLAPVGENMASWQGEWLYIKTVNSGWLMVEQSGQRQRFGAGSFFIIDPSLPYLESVPQQVELTALRIPKALLASRGRAIAVQPFIVPDLSQPDVHAARDLISCIASQSDTPGLSMRSLLGTQLVDLVNLTLLSPGTTSIVGHPLTALYRAKRFIEQHLENEQLNIADVAASVHLSGKHLQKIFREEGTTLMRYVWERRLEKAFGLLSAPDQATLNIQEVAWCCGFANASHFSRVFREAYGLTPRDFKGNTGVKRTG